jgi:nitrite reductase/ring-hydroxylating ferredoxin subunit
MQMPTVGAPRVRVAIWSELEDRSPAYALVAGVDLVVIRFDDQVSVMFGRCHHRGALLADGHIVGQNLICGVHGWDYRYDTGVSEYQNEEALHRFSAEIDVEEDAVWVEEAEIAAFAETHPQPYRRDEYLGLYQDVHGTPAEPFNAYIQTLARDGLSRMGHHGKMSAMGVPLTELPQWADIQLLTAQLATRPLMDNDPVDSALVIGPGAAKPLKLDVPIFVSDMSFGALSEEAKVALAMGAELGGTGICSGEGGMLPEEQEANSRYFYELASAQFGWSLDKVAKCQAFHFKGGQGAKTGTGGHLPGEKVVLRSVGWKLGAPRSARRPSPISYRWRTFVRLRTRAAKRRGEFPLGSNFRLNTLRPISTSLSTWDVTTSSWTVVAEPRERLRKSSSRTSRSRRWPHFRARLAT